MERLARQPAGLRTLRRGPDRRVSRGYPAHRGLRAGALAVTTNPLSNPPHHSAAKAPVARRSAWREGGMRRPPQLGQSARPLHENGTSRSRPQSPHRQAANPPAKQSTLQQVPKRPLDKPGQAVAVALPGGHGQEGLQVILHDLVERTLGGAPQFRRSSNGRTIQPVRRTACQRHPRRGGPASVRAVTAGRRFCQPSDSHGCADSAISAPRAAGALTVTRIAYPCGVRVDVECAVPDEAEERDPRLLGELDREAATAPTRRTRSGSTPIHAFCTIS